MNLTLEQNIEQLNIISPKTSNPVVSYMNCLRTRNLSHLSDKWPLKPNGKYIINRYRNDCRNLIIVFMLKIIPMLWFLCLSYSATAQQHPQFIKVEGGSFTMGDKTKKGEGNERPIHKVTISTFSISKTEITVGQYRAYCEAKKTSMPEEPYWELNDNQPIVNITWNEAVAYTKWLSQQLGKEIRLPYEAEWEYAAKGGNKSKDYIYSGTNNIFDVWFEDNSNDQAHNVASKTPNELGLYDMSGNVWEWCLDYYDKDYYSKTPEINPKGPSIGNRNVIRGGGYFYKPVYCRVTQRSHAEPDYVSYVFGFRVVMKE